MQKFEVGDKVTNSELKSFSVGEVLEYLIRTDQYRIKIVEHRNKNCIGGFRTWPGRHLCKYEGVTLPGGDKLKHGIDTTVPILMRNYTFKTSSPEAIDYVRIAEDCTYKNPVIFVGCGSEQVAIIHRSVMGKARIISDSNMDALSIVPLTENYYFCSLDAIKDRSKVMAFVRRVIYSRWPESASTKVEVHIPKI